jgi:cephalosporin hydroxylase
VDLEAFIQATKDRVAARHNAIPSYYEGWVARQASVAATVETRARLDRRLRWREQGRFVPWPQRRQVDLSGLWPRRRSEIPDDVLIMSQGVMDVLRWRGLELFKSVFDFALLPMVLAEIRPATILEIGSGGGASAVWLADIAAMQELDCTILSVDVAPVTVEHPGVRFILGDAGDLGRALPPEWGDRGPRVVIEDAHVNVDRAIEYVDAFLRPGDYLIVEDSIGKADTLGRFHASRPGVYAVDTRYTDFFGRNATSCIDSIFVKLT